MGPLLCFWTGGIRRAEQARLRWSLAPPRGERARDCAARSASRPPPVRRIPPSCGNRRGRAHAAHGPSALPLDRWDSKGGTENAAVRHFPALGSDGPQLCSLEGKQQEASAENPTLSAKAEGPCSAWALCFAFGQVGFEGRNRRGSGGASPRPGENGQETAPRGAQAGRRPCGESHPLLCLWTGGIRRAEQKMPQCGIFPPREPRPAPVEPRPGSLAPPREERAREQIRPAGGCPAGAARRAAAPCAQTSISLPANPLLLPLHIISGVTCKSTREPSTAFTAMKSRSGSPSPRSSS